MSADKAIMDEWANALDSGKYKQGKSQLVIEHENGSPSYCCLGVLCEIAYERGIVERTKSDMGIMYDRNGAVLPTAVMEWAGLPDVSPHVTVPEGVSIVDEDDHPITDESLISLNDAFGADFHQIAECIRYTYGGK